MSWVHSSPVEIAALFAEGAIFGAIALRLADDAAMRLAKLRRSIERTRSRDRLAAEIRALRSELSLRSATRMLTVADSRKGRSDGVFALNNERRRGADAGTRS